MTDKETKDPGECLIEFVSLLYVQSAIAENNYLRIEDGPGRKTWIYPDCKMSIHIDSKTGHVWADCHWVENE